MVTVNYVIGIYTTGSSRKCDRRVFKIVLIADFEAINGITLLARLLK